MSVEKSELKRRYAKMKTAELIQLQKSGGLTEDAVLLLKAELDTRTIDEDTLDDVANLSEAKEATKKSESWLHEIALIVLGGIFTIVCMFLFFPYLTEGQRAYLLLAFIIGGPLYIIQTIYSKIKKRKKPNHSSIAAKEGASKSNNTINVSVKLTDLKNLYYQLYHQRNENRDTIYISMKLPKL